ncbi:hypothetical protein Lesp02_25880 [Lentzea sp. NBRC 105346]|nr:hypothetical protein Lesp02_25880 [Lentzea sp. NBRC 105346]
MLVAAACGSVIVGYAAVAAVLALVAATATHAAFSTTGVLTAAAPAWLAAHHVPLWFDAGQLGVLPLLPTALLMLLVGRTAAGTADRLGLYEPLQARAVVLSIAGAHAFVGGTIALMMGDGVVRATPAVAFFGCAAVSGVAATLGVARRCGLVEVLFERLDPVALQGLRTGFMSLFALVSAGAAAMAFGLVTSWSTTSSLFDQAGETVGVGLGMWLLCLGYLPNAIIAGMSYVTGAGLSIGTVTVTPMKFVGGPVPGVPLFAALPQQEFVLSPMVLVIAVAIGGFAGWSCRKVADNPATRMRAVLIAAVTVAVGCLVLAATAGGRLAGGAFDPVTIPAGLLALLAAAWVLGPGMAVAWLAGPRPKPVAVMDDEFGEIDEELAQELAATDLAADAEPDAEQPEDGEPVDGYEDEADDDFDEEFDEDDEEFEDELDEEFDEELGDDLVEDPDEELDEELEEPADEPDEAAEPVEEDLDGEPEK